MKVSTKNIKQINSRLEYLYNNFNLVPLDEMIKIGDEEIYIKYPDECDIYNIYYSVEDFMLYTDNLASIQVVNDHSVISGNIRQTIVDFNDYYYENLVPEIKFETDKYSMKIVKNPFLIGIVTSRDGIYNEDMGIFPCSYYKAIEIVYKGKRESEEDDIRFIKSCLYYIASKYNVSMSIGKFGTWNDFTDVQNDDSIIVGESALIPYCRAMDYYIEALTIEKADIKYLHLYKIIEYFSPIVSQKASYEQLNNRLDALQVIERDYEYLESIFNLAKQYQISLKDNELANTVLKECVDIALLFSFLPESIKKGLSKTCHFAIKDIKNLNSSIIESVKKEIAGILYATRNCIVHAKSNYTITGKECPEEDLDQLNEFMAKLSECLFVWNSRQSKGLQLR